MTRARLFSNRPVRATAAIGTLVAAALFLFSALTGFHVALPVIALVYALCLPTLVLSVSISLSLKQTRSRTNALHSDLRRADRSLHEVRSTLRSFEKDSRETAAGRELVLQRLDDRTRRTTPAITDIAGSIGKMAPLVRDIHAATPRSTGDATSTGPRPTSPAESAPEAGSTKADASAYKFPEIVLGAAAPNFPGVHVAVIADEFTARAFAHEWDISTPTPDSWRSEFEARRPDFLFVESAWEGNGRSWLYHLVGPSAPRPAVHDIVTYCRDNDIPTIFWNKEDPPHFEDFLETAALFDHVYTTDGNLIDAYRERLGHERVSVLPFAAQPKIHNPARVGRVPRDRSIAFGGMYFRHKYPERREQLDTLLPAASRLGLDIYSRQAGGDPNYQFPAPYSDHVRGSLPYRQMLTAYHAYKVILNVNSVVDSPTMCARRIFEATASGAAVVTTPTPAIEEFFPDGLLTTVSSEDDAYNKMRALVRSTEYRDRLVHRAQRQIWETATYRHRAEQVMTDLRIPTGTSSQQHSIVVTSNRPEHVDMAFANAARQTIENKQLIFLSHGFELSSYEQSRLRDRYQLDDVGFLHAESSESLGSNLNRLFSTAEGDIIFRMDDDDYYGANYSRDLLHALSFSGSQVVGKAESYIYFEESDSTVLTYIGHSHRHTDFIRGATFCGRREVFNLYKFPDARRGEDSDFLAQVRKDGGTVYSADRFNFLVRRRAAKDSHTWTVSDAKLFSSGEMRFIGDDPRQVDV